MANNTSGTEYSQYKNNLSKLHGSFYITYDGSGWSVSDSTGQIGYVSKYGSAYPSDMGITANTHDGSYTYTPQRNDYILLKLYSDEIEIIDTTIIAMQLAQQGYDVLEECSQPAFGFDISCANFILLPEYTEWTEDIGFNIGNITLGTEITVIDNSGTVYRPFVQEMSFEYDNPDSLQFTFGNKFALGKSEFTLGQLLSETTSLAQRTQRTLSAYGDSTSTSTYSNSTVTQGVQEQIDKANQTDEDLQKQLEQEQAALRAEDAQIRAELDAQEE